jgi:hypothetical protein
MVRTGDPTDPWDAPQTIADNPVSSHKEFDMNRFILMACCTAASLLLITEVASADKDYDWRRWGNSIEGAWQVEVTVRLPAEDCTTSPPVPVGPNPFPSFDTFHEGGTMNEHGSRSSPARRSPGFGVWERTGYRKFAYRDIFHSFDADGLLFATMDITSDLKLSKNGDTFTGVSRFVRTEVSGIVRHFCATMSGERITL